VNIVFDLDGTLIDSAPDIQAVANKVLLTEGLQGLSIEETRRFVGEGAAVFVERMMGARNITQSEADFSRLHDTFLSHYSHAVDKTVLYPGVEETLALLKKQGHRLGLCTNKPEAPARAVVAHLKLTEYFDAFVAGGMTDTRKPDPQMLLLAVDRLGGGSTVYVGDSEIDASTAERADIPFALFTEGYRKSPVSLLHHQWAFSEFRQLADIITAADLVL